MFIVERYLPGLDPIGFERTLERLHEVTRDTPVRYLGSTIVPDDEACFCQFEAPLAELVAEVNHRAGLPFDRIVVGVVVSAAPPAPAP